MATTKLKRMKEASGKNKAIHLKKNIHYICNPEKTENRIWIGGNAGQTPEQIYNSMIMNKRVWQKQHGSQGFHYMLSFPPDCEVSEELAFRIAQEFCEELLGDDHLYVFAVHNDKPHMHAHITFDSVSRTDGYKFHSPKGDWERRIQPITDRLCKKYNLPTLQYDPEKKEGIHYGEWKSRKEGNEKYDWNDIIRDDIDIAISEANSYEEFLEWFNKEQYEIRDGKYLSLKPHGKDEPVRTKYLGAGYNKEDIIFRIDHKSQKASLEEKFKTYGNITVVRRSLLYCIHNSNGMWKMSALQKKYYKRWMNTFLIRKPVFADTWKYKKDILEVHKYGRQLCYVLDHDITNKEILEKKVHELLGKKKEVEMLLQVTKTSLYKNAPLKKAYEYIKLYGELKKYPPDSRKDLEVKLEALREEIENILPLDEAIEHYQTVKTQYDFYRAELKEIREEFNICVQIMEADFHSYDLDERWIKEQYHAKDKKTGKDNFYTRITINEKMFRDSDKEDYILTRIPYKKDEYVYLPKNHVRYLNDGKIASAFLYHDLKYEVVDHTGKPLNSAYGENLKKSYEDKTKTWKHNSKKNIDR